MHTYTEFFKTYTRYTKLCTNCVQQISKNTLTLYKHSIKRTQNDTQHVQRITKEYTKLYIKIDTNSVQQIY